MKGHPQNVNLFPLEMEQLITRMTRTIINYVELNIDILLVLSTSLHMGISHGVLHFGGTLQSL